MRISGYARVRVALTSKGVDVLNRIDGALMAGMSSHEPYAKMLRDRINSRRAGDIYETDIWTLMSEFGPHITVGGMLPFCGGEIEVIDGETHRNDLKRRMYRV